MYASHATRHLFSNMQVQHCNQLNAICTVRSYYKTKLQTQERNKNSILGKKERIYMMFNRFTQRAQKVLQLAQEEAIRMEA